MNKQPTIADLLGKTLVSVTGCEADSDEVIFTTSEGEKFKLWHSQDCCEHVCVHDVVGDPADLIGNPLTLAEEVDGESPAGFEPGNDSHTWTFYKLATTNGYVDIRWLGESNGYYSESVDFERMGPQ